MYRGKFEIVDGLREELVAPLAIKMPKIFVFNEFVAFDKLCQIVDCPVTKATATTTAAATVALDLLFQTNIKIFFDSKNSSDTEHAYRIKQILEDNSIAVFVTDQLITKTKNNAGQTHQILLPKDRIIMRLL